MVLFFTSSRIERIRCDREDSAFILVEEIFLLAAPRSFSWFTLVKSGSNLLSRFIKLLRTWMKGHHVVKVDGYFRSNWIKVRISWTDIFQISLVRIEKNDVRSCLGLTTCPND